MQTKMAKRLLRSTILQPSIEPAIVEGRLEVVEGALDALDVFGLRLKTGMHREANVSVGSLG